LSEEVMKIGNPKSDSYIPRDWRFFFFLHLAPFPIGFVACLLMTLFLPAAHGDPTLLWAALALASVGVVLLFTARLPLYRQGKYFSFGPRLLSPGHKRLYWISYAFIATSILIMALLLILLRNSG
jgi:hypothetical protein